MRLITFRSNSEPDDPDAYWRRRFFILGGGLAVLMLLAWLFGGGGPGKQASQTAASRAATAARENRNSLPGPATGQPYGQSSASPSPSVSPSATASGAPGKGASGQGAKCAAGRVVLSLFTTQTAYRGAEPPTFRVYAVSTSESACKMKFGPAGVRILVTRHGKTVWDSASCPASRPKARTTTMTPGVPQQVTLTWDRKAYGRSCAGTLPSGGSGTFEAMAQADGHFSPMRPFTIMPSPASAPRRSASQPRRGAGLSPRSSRSGPRPGRHGHPRLR